MSEKDDQQSRNDPFAQWREDWERASEAWLRMMPLAAQNRAFAEMMRAMVYPFAVGGQAPRGGNGESTRERQPGSGSDPFAVWRDQAVEAWAKTMAEMVNTRGFAESTGAMLDAYGAMGEPFQEAIQSSVDRVQHQMNMPTRSDITKILERLTNIEKRLDDLAAGS